MKTPAERYRQDPYFYNIVNLLRAELARGDFTPSELREAVILAATMHEMEHVRPLFPPNKGAIDGK